MKGKKKVTTKDSWKSGRRKRETISNVARPFSSLNQLTSSTYSSFYSNRMKPTPKELWQTQHSRAHWNSVTLTSRIWPRSSLSLSLSLPLFPLCRLLSFGGWQEKGKKLEGISFHIITDHHKEEERGQKTSQSSRTEGGWRESFLFFIFSFLLGKYRWPRGVYSTITVRVLCVCVNENNEDAITFGDLKWSLPIFFVFHFSSSFILA